MKKMKNQLILLKLGGSLITDKSQPFTARKEVITRLGKEIKAARNKLKGKLIIAHGSGSFGHIPAKKYGTAGGFKNQKGKFGACFTADIAARINRIVIKELLKIGLPIVSIVPSSIFMAQGKKPTYGFLDLIPLLLNKQIIPVLYGDVIWDTKIGCCIFSAEIELGILARYLIKRGYKIRRIIQVGIEDGVYQWETKKLIRKITSNNFNRLKREIRGSASIDVTGGMLHKVEESLKMTKIGIQTYIINGNKKGLLYNLLIGKRVTGTVISK